jgi:hypothetical protein
MAFLSEVRKENAASTGNTHSFSHIRMLHNSILFGAKQQGTVLTGEYHQLLDVYIKSFQKESIVAKRMGATEENESEAMRKCLYCFIMNYASGQLKMVICMLGFF